ncbi:hypothetical protein [Hahella ganghwensis]|uniref:hypothetical protein n=1 Tax=Hahella ganghwensis TaxID=286420 RepID=UPI000372023A|nr:hypothetical protein [Hahella ganghwensis]
MWKSQSFSTASLGNRRWIQPTFALIKSRFDLGYIVELEDGTEAQLRVLEQKGRELELHVAGKEETICGERIPVYVTYQDDKYCSVSQISPEERSEREAIKKRKQSAIDSCETGDVYTMIITKDYEWGYLCDQADGYLSGAIKKPTKLLNIGDRAAATVIGKNKHGAPYLSINNEVPNT